MKWIYMGKGAFGWGETLLAAEYDLERVDRDSNIMAVSLFISHYKRQQTSTYTIYV